MRATGHPLPALPGYDAAFVLDPDGSVEAVYR
jgi:hypothetical protein